MWDNKPGSLNGNIPSPPPRPSLGGRCPGLPGRKRAAGRCKELKNVGRNGALYEFTAERFHNSCKLRPSSVLLRKPASPGGHTIQCSPYRQRFASGRMISSPYRGWGILDATIQPVALKRPCQHRKNVPGGSGNALDRYHPRAALKNRAGQGRGWIRNKPQGVSKKRHEKRRKI